MPSRRAARSRRTGARLTSVVAVLAAVVGATAAHAATPAATGATGATAQAAPATRVVLPTGDTVRVGRLPDGRPSYSVLAADRSGIAGSFSNVDVAGEHYVLPGEAKVLLGSLVDPSLFDVSALAASGSSDTLTATVTSASAKVPGLTVTRRTPTTITGHVDAAGSAAFRSALVDAATAVGAGHTQTSFPGVTRLSGTASPGVVTPDYPQVALNVALKGPAGQPAPSGVVVLVNTDDVRRFDQFVFLDRGRARLSVPLGHYSGIANTFSFDGRRAASVDVPVADYTVSDDSQTLTFDTTTATVAPSVVLPGSPQVQDTTVSWVRGDATGRGVTGFSDEAGDGLKIRWAPTPAPQIGTQAWETGFHAAAGATATPTTYDLGYRDEGAVPSSGRHVEGAADLATIDSSYYEDRRGESFFGRGALFAQDGFASFGLFPLRTPAEVTQYVNDADGVQWVETLIGKAGGFRSFGGDVVDQAVPQTYRAGTTTPVDWLRGPLAPGPFETGPGSPPDCSVCRTPTTLQIALAPFTDTVPGHIGEGTDPEEGTPGIRTSLTVGGKQIAGGADRILLTASVPAAPRRYQLTVSADRSGDGTTLSTGSRTTYGFTSGAQTGEPTPAGGTCRLAPDPSSCRTLGLLRVTAPLPTDLFRRVPVGRSTFRMTVAPYGGSTQRITSASVGLSVDGTTFTPASVTRVGAQQFDVTLSSPASWAGEPVTFRVTAADADGDTLTQTTTAAYAVAGN